MIAQRPKEQVTMNRLLVILAFGLAAVSAGPLAEDQRTERIVGGTTTTIQTYPEMAALLHSFTGIAHMQACGGTVLNNRAVLSAAHCFHGHATRRWRVRLGSTNANSLGRVFSVSRIIIHPSYNPSNLDNDIGILRLSSTITFSNSIRAGQIAGTNYNLADNQRVWAVGWGATREGGLTSERLRHVQVYAINQQRCVNAYSPRRITLNMLCSGVMGVGGRDQCQGDSGGPLFHNRVVVGVCSFGRGCARPTHPGVNARVSRFATWINNNR